MHPHQLTTPDSILAFMFAGNARFTLVSPKTGVRFTYRVRRSEPDQTGRAVYFLSVLTGEDNESAYSYAGLLSPSLSIKPTRASKISIDAPSFKAIAWFCGQLAANRVGAEFWHEGRCGRCGRTLTVPESLSSGFGPECAAKLAA